MPIYEYACQQCACTFDVFCPISERNNPQPCPHCKGLLDGQGSLIMSAPLVKCDDIVNVPWLESAATNASNDHRHGRKRIETRAEYAQYLKDNGLRETDGGMNRSEV